MPIDAEHRHLADQLAAVLWTGDDDPRLAEEWRSLADALQHHAGSEERDMFPEVALMPAAELEAMGERLAARKEQLRASRVTQTRLRFKHQVLRHT